MTETSDTLVEPSRFKLNVFSVAFKIILLLVSVFFAYKVSYWIVETFFFDKFFYSKNKDYGYFTQNSEPLSDFTPRSDDVVKLLNQARKPENKQVSGVLGTDTETYMIALIGDTFVWGQGWENPDRYYSVSKYELDSSKYMTAMYSNIIYRQLMANNHLNSNNIK